MQGFLLGLTTGTVCVAYCAPVLIPYFLGEGQRVYDNFLRLGQYVLGRLVGYLLFGVLAWVTHRVIFERVELRGWVLGAVYLILAVLLVFYGLTPPKAACAAGTIRRFDRQVMAKIAPLMPLILGFLTGLNLCPPFLLAFTEAVRMGSLAGSVYFFFTFFLGTLVFFLPLPLIGVLRHHQPLQIIGRMTAVLVAVYYGWMGLILLT